MELTVYFEPVLLPEVEADTLRNIVHPIDVLRFPCTPGKALPHLGKTLRSHAFAVVAHQDNGITLIFRPFRSARDATGDAV